MNPIRLRAAITTLVATVVAGGCSEQIDDTFEATPGGQLVIDLPQGAVQVEAHNADEVRIVASAEGFNAFFFDFDVDQDDDGIELRGDLGFFRVRYFDLLDIEVVAKVPKSYAVEMDVKRGQLTVTGLDGAIDLQSRNAEVEVSDVGHAGVSVDTRNGSVHAREIRGDAKLATRNGEIIASRISGGLQMKTRNGRIEASELGAAVVAETKNGPIRISQVRGPIRASTRNGAISLSGANASIDAKTRNGAIEANFSGLPAGRLETRNGSIDIRIPSSAGVQLHADTRRGQVWIHERFGVSPDSGESIHAALNGGGALLEATTRSADIHVEPFGPPSVALGPEAATR